MAAKTATPTAEAPPEATESPPEKPPTDGGTGTRDDELKEALGRAEAAEARAKTAEGALGRINDRFDAIEARLQVAPAPTPAGEAPAPPLKPPEQWIRAFVAPQHPNFEKVIVVGKVKQVRDPSSALGYRDHAREGDVKIRFRGGVWKSIGESGSEQDQADDKVRIAWCEKHEEIARDVMDPKTPVWFAIKQGQMETSRKESSFSRNINVDAALAGDMSQLGAAGGDVVDQTRKQVEGANRGA